MGISACPTPNQGMEITASSTGLGKASLQTVVSLLTADNSIGSKTRYNAPISAYCVGVSP